ncbi:MAG: ATP-grasp domain-containing protein [Fuerstiella sp.]
MTSPDLVLAGASVRSLAASAIRDGLCPVCIDMFADADLRRLLVSRFGTRTGLLHQICSFDQVPEVLRQVTSDLPVVLAGGLENHAAVVARIADDRPLAGTPPAVIRQLRNPNRLFRVLTECGVSVPQWRTAASRIDRSNFSAEGAGTGGDSAKDRAENKWRKLPACDAEERKLPAYDADEHKLEACGAEQHKLETYGAGKRKLEACATFRHDSHFAFGPKSPSGRRWLRKMIVSSGGQGVTWHASDTSGSANAVAVASDACFLQEFVEGTAASATFLAAGDAEDGASERAVNDHDRQQRVRLLGTALQLSGLAELNAGTFQFCGNAGPIRVNRQLRPKIERVGQVLADNFGLRGVFGVDFIVQNNDPIVVEVNPRVTASHELHEWAHPQLPGHVVLHLEGVPKLLNSVPDPAADPGPWARLVLYSRKNLVLSTSQQTELLNLAASNGFEAPARRIRVADIPETGQPVPTDSPLCSLYVDLRVSPDQIKLFARRLTTVIRQSHGFSKELVRQIQVRISDLQSDREFGNS